MSFSSFSSLKYGASALVLTLCLATAIPNAQAEETEEDFPKYGLLLTEDEKRLIIAKDAIKSDEAARSFGELVTLYKQKKYHDVFYDLLTLARNGNADAQQLIGLMYRSGQGVKQNDKRALHWLQNAANKGKPLAQHHLGLIHYNGEGTIRDSIKALMWVNLAVNHYPEGKEKERAETDRDSLIKQLNTKEQSKAQAMMDKWYELRQNHLDQQPTTEDTADTTQNPVTEKTTPAPKKDGTDKAKTETKPAEPKITKPDDENDTDNAWSLGKPSDEKEESGNDTDKKTSSDEEVFPAPRN